MAYGPPPPFMPYEPFLLGVGVVFNLLKRPPKLLIQHVLTVRFSGPACCSSPGLHLGLGASDCFPVLAFCFIVPSAICLDLLSAAPLAPVQKQDTQLQHRGAHADNNDPRRSTVSFMRVLLLTRLVIFDGPIRANRFADLCGLPDSHESPETSRAEPLLRESRFGALKHCE